MRRARKPIQDLTPAPPRGPVPRERGAVIGDGIAWTALWSGRVVLIALGAVVLGLLVSKVWSVVFPVLLALLVASVLEKPARFLERRLHFPVALAAAAVLLGSLAVVIGIVVAISPSVAGQSANIVSDATAGLQKLQDYVQRGDFVTSKQIDAGLQSVQDKLSSSGGAIASGVLTGVGAAASVLVTFVITLILTFLFLKDGRHFRPFVRRIAGGRVGPHLDEVLDRSWSTLGGYIRTQALVSLIDAVLIGTALLIVGVPLAIPLAILTFFGGFIPIIGAFVAGVVAVLVALVSDGPTGALIIFAVILGVQQLEGNVLSPFLQSRSMQLHSAVVLLSVTLGSTLFGIAGAFLAVPVAAVAAVVLRYLDETITLATKPPQVRPGQPVILE